MVLTLGLQITLERTLFSFPWIIGGFGRNVIVHRPRFLGLSFVMALDTRWAPVEFGAAWAAVLVFLGVRPKRLGQRQKADA